MKLLLTLAGAITALLSSKSVLAEYGLNMTQGITDISKDIYDLHMMVFWVCVAIGVVVFGAIICVVLLFINCLAKNQYINGQSYLEFQDVPQN